MTIYFDEAVLGFDEGICTDCIVEKPGKVKEGKILFCSEK